MNTNKIMIEEAIRLLKEDAKEIEKLKNVVTPHFTMAIEALEKQTPTKLIDTWKGKKCPNCKEEIDFDTISEGETEYCPKCGQRWYLKTL